jgi:hypothetical protein
MREPSPLALRKNHLVSEDSVYSYFVLRSSAVQFLNMV